MNVNKENRYPI